MADIQTTNVPILFNTWLNWICTELPTVKKELPDLLNISERTLEGWQYSNKTPRLPKIAQLAKTLGVSIDDIVQNNQNVSLDKMIKRINKLSKQQKLAKKKSKTFSNEK